MNKPVTRPGQPGTDRRSFLKSGAIAVAPLAVAVPGAAIAMDDSGAKLARIEDERAIEALHRGVLRSLNSADVRPTPPNLVSLTPDASAELQIAIAPDGRSACARHACRAQFEIVAAGQTTVERMVRFQGHGRGLTSEQRTLVAEYTKNEKGWGVAKLHLA